MQCIAKTEFTGQINIVTMYSIKPQGIYTSTMELYSTSPLQSLIDWSVNDTELGVTIGIWHDKDKVIHDFGGVFDMPKEAIELLEANGYDITYLLD